MTLFFFTFVIYYFVWMFATKEGKSFHQTKQTNFDWIIHILHQFNYITGALHGDVILH